MAGYSIELSEDAERQLVTVAAHGRAILVDAMKKQLRHEPTSPSRHRKQLKPNPLAAWELRVGEFRVFYNVDQSRSAVLVVAIGMKVHNRLLIEGQEFSL